MSIRLVNHLTSAFRSASWRRHKPRRRALQRCSTESLESRLLLSAVVELVQDLNTEPAGGLSYARPDRDVFPVGDTLYFLGQTTLHGSELWKSDGTESGTLRLTDINPGPSGSSITQFENVNGVLYFIAVGPLSGTALWRSDGTVGGTEKVLQFSPQVVQISDLTNVNGTLFFRRSNELWKTDGTPGNEARVSTPPGRIVGMQAAADRLFFSLEDNTTGESSIWISDGTAAGTLSLKNGLEDVDLTDESSAAIGGTIYFGGSDPTTGKELWVSDGTVSGTHMVKDIHPGRLPSLNAVGLMTAMEGVLYFEAWDGSTGSELWRSDGTIDGTILVKDTEPGPSSGNIAQLISTEGKLFFRTNDTIWSSDGTTFGTVRLPGLVDGISWETPLAGLGGNVYFGKQLYGKTIVPSTLLTEVQPLDRLPQLLVVEVGQRNPDQLNERRVHAPSESN